MSTDFFANAMGSMMQSDEFKLEKEFLSNLEKFGINKTYLSKYTEEPGACGWNFGTVPLAQKVQQEQEAEVFMRCVTLEEELETEADPERRKTLTAEINELKFEMECLKQLRDKPTSTNPSNESTAPPKTDSTPPPTTTPDSQNVPQPTSDEEFEDW